MSELSIYQRYVLFNMLKKKHKFFCSIKELHYICTLKKIVFDLNGSKGFIGNYIEGSY